MSFIDKLSTLIPLGKKEEAPEYFFALNIGSERLTVALWCIHNKNLQILQTASSNYSSIENIAEVTDSLLDTVVGLREIEPAKILFGVPDLWLVDENLKEDYLKVLRKLVKDLELSPMAYVATSHALVHLLEKKEGIPVTAILVGFEQEHLEVVVSQAGRVEGARLIERGEESGINIEKALLSFSTIETLPSKMLLYGHNQEQLIKLKGSLLSYPWMSKLSFLHFPKIEVLEEEIEIDSVCLAGASELEPSVVYSKKAKTNHAVKPIPISEKKEKEDENISRPIEEDTEQESTDTDFGFMVGDVAKEVKSEKPQPAGEAGKVKSDSEEDEISISKSQGKDNLDKEDEEDQNFLVPQESEYEEFGQAEDEKSLAVHTPSVSHASPVQTGKFKKGFLSRSRVFGLALLLICAFLTVIYIFIPKVTVKVFVEPKTLEKDAQVIADPKVEKIDEVAKIIPAKIVQTDVSGSSKAKATGSKQIGDSAKGTVIIINNTAKGQSFPSGTLLTVTGGLKFKLDSSASVSATLSDADSKSTVTVSATALAIGADSNIPSGTKLAIEKFKEEQFVAKSQGNFSGGSSKEVTVVSSDDQQKLLAQVSVDLRKKAQEALQDKNQDKKILSEALTEQILKKSFSKNVNDQASEFSLDMSGRYKGSSFNENDLKLIVGKLVTTQVPDGYGLDLSNTETQADVSNVDKDGKIVFLAKFKAQLIPKIDTESIKDRIKGKTVTDAGTIIKNIDNVLGSEMIFKPSLPPFLQRIPFISKNINMEVGFK